MFNVFLRSALTFGLVAALGCAGEVSSHGADGPGATPQVPSDTVAAQPERFPTVNPAPPDPPQPVVPPPCSGTTSQSGFTSEESNAALETAKVQCAAHYERFDSGFDVYHRFKTPEGAACVQSLNKAISPSCNDQGTAWGGGAVRGTMYTTQLGYVVPGTQIFLEPFVQVGGTLVPSQLISLSASDPSGFTNAVGQFYLDRVPEGRYYLYIWTVYNYLDAYRSAEDLAANKPVVVDVEAGKTLDLGVVFTFWPS